VSECVVAVDHYAIKAWRAVVRKAEQFIPELLWKLLNREESWPATVVCAIGYGGAQRKRRGSLNP
jgi:hypothetical protein